MTAMHRLSHHRRAHRPAVLVPLAIAAAPGAVAALALQPSHAPHGAGVPHRVSVRVAAIRAAAETAATAAGAGAAAAVAAAPAAAAAGAAGTTVPGACACPMFPAGNVWNTDISKLPVSPYSSAWLASMDSAGTFLHPDFGPDQGSYPYGIPYTIATRAQPLVRIRFKYASESNKGPYPFGPDTRIEGGQKAGGDRHAIMVSKDSCTLYEMWDARFSAHGSTAGSGAIWNLRSNALRPAGWTSADAAGLPILPGLLNFSEVRAAARTGAPIRHSIRLTAARSRSAFIWPARHEAGSGADPNLPPMGARFRLKASFSVARFCASKITPYCADAKVVLTEMQYYGLILADNGGNWYFQGSAFPQWPDALVSLFKLIPASAFQAVNESCLEVSRNSGLARARRDCPIG